MQKLARFLALGLVLGVASLPSSAAGAQPDPQSLAVLARQTLASECSVLVGGADQSLVASVDEFGAPRSGAEQLAFTKARREFNAQFGLRYVRFDVQIVPMDVSARGGDLELVAEERTTLCFINSMHAHDPLRDLTRSRRITTTTTISTVPLRTFSSTTQHRATRTGHTRSREVSSECATVSSRMPAR